MGTNRVPISINMAGTASSRPSTPPVGAPGQRIRILIVNNHLLFRDGMRKLLSAVPDFNVVGEAEDGDEVMEMTAQLQPDVVLLDLSTQGQEGSITLQRLRAAHPDVKAILLMFWAEQYEMLQAMRFGTAGIVQKSAPTEQLIKSIRKVHAGEVWLEQNTIAEVVHQTALAPEQGYGSLRKRRKSSRDSLPKTRQN